MPHQAYVSNPFMMMVDPEVVLAAVAKSERLGQLNRHLCRPLDKPAPQDTSRPDAAAELVDDEDLASDPAAQVR